MIYLSVYDPEPACYLSFIHHHLLHDAVGGPHNITKTLQYINTCISPMLPWHQSMPSAPYTGLVHGFCSTGRHVWRPPSPQVAMRHHRSHIIIRTIECMCQAGIICSLADENTLATDVPHFLFCTSGKHNTGILLCTRAAAHGINGSWQYATAPTPFRVGRLGGQSGATGCPSCMSDSVLSSKQVRHTRTQEHDSSIRRAAYKVNLDHAVSGSCLTCI